VAERRKVTYESRVDPRVVAALCTFYKDNNISVSSLSDLISTSLEDFLTILEKRNFVVRVKGTLEAKKLLEGEFGRAAHRRGERSLIRQIQMEEGEIARAEVHTSIPIEDIKFGERPGTDK